MNHEVSVVIPSFNRVEELRSLLDNFLTGDVLDGVSFYVSLSRRDSELERYIAFLSVQKYKNINVLICETQGASAQRNFAFQNVEPSTAVVFIDDDIITTSGDLKAFLTDCAELSVGLKLDKLLVGPVIKHMDVNTTLPVDNEKTGAIWDALIILGCYDPRPGRVARSGWHSPIYWPSESLGGANPDEVRVGEKGRAVSVQWLPTGVVFLSASLVDLLYGKEIFWDTAGSSYLEDLDFSHRLWVDGTKLLVVKSGDFYHRIVSTSGFKVGYYEVLRRGYFVSRTKHSWKLFYLTAILKAIDFLKTKPNKKISTMFGGFAALFLLSTQLIFFPQLVKNTNKSKSEVESHEQDKS